MAAVKPNLEPTLYTSPEKVGILLVRVLSQVQFPHLQQGGSAPNDLE